MELVFATELYTYWYDGESKSYYITEETGQAQIPVERNDVLTIALAINRNAYDAMARIEQRHSKYPLHLKKMVREHAYDTEDYDITHDDKIEQMSPQDFFMHVCQYDGLLSGYHNTIKGWVQSIFGVNLDSIKR